MIVSSLSYESRFLTHVDTKSNSRPFGNCSCETASKIVVVRFCHRLRRLRAQNAAVISSQVLAFNGSLRQVRPGKG